MVILRAGGAPRPFGGLRDSAVCPTCTVFLVRDGWITDVEGDGELRAVATSGGHVEQRRRDGREVPPTVANRVRDDESDGLRGRVRGVTADGSHVRGLVLDGTRLVAFLVGSAPLPVAPLRAPALFVRPLPGDSVQLLGFQFPPGARQHGVTVLVEGDTVASGVAVGADGRFDTRARVRRPPGWVVVTAVQQDGLRTTLATTNLQVVDR